MQNTDLPPGVTIEQVPITAPGAKAAVPAPVEPPANDVTGGEEILSEETDVQSLEDGGGIKTWNALQILAGILITTVSMFMINYYRQKVLKTDPEVQKIKLQLDLVKNDIGEIKKTSS